MMKFICFLIFLCSHICLYSQSIRWFYVRNPSQKLEVDTCVYSISYKAKFYLDERKDVVMYDHCILEVGSKMSSYYSFYADQQDSIMFQRRKSSRGVDPRTELKKKLGLSSNEKGVYADCYKNYPTKGHLTISHGLDGMEYIYGEPFPSMNWDVIPDSDTTILNFSCKKALLAFRGRTYTAWFSSQIPINDGPWKFQGLPGLILKITDVDGFFDWEITQLQEKRKPIYVYAHKGIRQRKCTRAEYYKMLRLMGEDPIAYAISQGKSPRIIKDGKVLLAKPGEKTFPKVPEIELE